MTSKQKATAKVRSLDSADAQFAAAKGLVARLRASAASLDAEESELLYRVSTRPPSAEKTGRVAKLLGDEAPGEDDPPDGIRARLKAIAAERVDVRAALEIATQRLQAARFGASRVICDEVAPAYGETVKALAAALLAAHDAHEDLLSIIAALNREDVAWTGALAPMQAHAIFGHNGSRLAGWLREAAGSGFIKSSEIPKELRA